MVKYVRSRFFLLGLLMALAFGSIAATVSYFGAGAADQLGVSLATLISGEDQTNNVLRVEGQFSYNGYKAADTQIKASAGYVHTVTCAGTDAAATAGTIILYDNTAESGTKIWQLDVAAVAMNTPFTVTLDAVATTGLYLGFTTTADVACTVSYR
jgi:hypothetical protein